MTEIEQAYETLWDDVTKQILTQTSQAILSSAISSLMHMLQTATLANTNVSKFIELEDELASSLHEAVAGRDELDAVTFSEDEVDKLAAVLLRLTKLFERRDMTAWMEENDGGKQSSGWDILCAIMERGRLGRKFEEVVSQVRVLRVTSLDGGDAIVS